MLQSRPERSAATPRTSSLYEKIFASFIQLLASAKLRGAKTVLIPDPQTLGDTYQELVESLKRLAQAELPLRIVPPSERV